MKLNLGITMLTMALLSTNVFSQTKLATTPSAGFGGGLNIGTIDSEIKEDQSPDMSNMINGLQGESAKRRGSKRFIDQAFSTNPFTSLFRVYDSTGSVTKKYLLATNGEKIVYATTTVSPQWITISSGYVHNQKWDYVQLDNVVIMANKSLSDPIKSFNVTHTSISNLISNGNFTIRAKELFVSRNQLIAGNIREVTSGATTYSSRFYYAPILLPSSFSALSYIDFDANDGQQIRDISGKDKVTHIWKDKKIGELDYDVLSPVPDGGDQTFRTVINGFGLYAPNTLVNTGDYYVFGAHDGIRVWQGQTRSRLVSKEESAIVSNNIHPIIRRTIEAGTYQKSTAFYYATENWYVWSYEDPEKQPRGRNNSVLVLDLDNFEWYPFDNILAESFTSFIGSDDTGELLYGDECFVHYVNRKLDKNDSYRSLSIQNMDSGVNDNGATLWRSGLQDTNFVLEGTGSVRMGIGTQSNSSITYMNVIDLTSWQDGKKITKDDKLTFKVYATSKQFISNIRVDLLIEDVKSNFTSNHTSVTLTSAIFNEIYRYGNSGSSWTKVSIAFSSFPILDSWISTASETFPFADSLIFYGLRLYGETGAGGGANVYFDDLRVEGKKESPLNAYRFTKKFNLASQDDKTFNSLLLQSMTSSDSEFFIDVFKDFGEYQDRIPVTGDFGREIFVAGYNNRNGVAKLDSVDFELLIETGTADRNAFAFRPCAVDDTWVYCGDHQNNSIVKLDKSSFTVFASTYGTLGSGTTNFRYIYQIALDETNLYILDFGNDRLKIHRKSDLSFVEQFGDLGNGTTQFSNPSGIAVDERYFYVAQDGNSLIQKFDKNDKSLNASAKLNLTTIADTTLSVDQKYLYVAYDQISKDSVENLDVILEKRFKSDLSLINRVRVTPQFSTVLSSYAVMGDISVSDEFLYITFTDDINRNGSYFVQKRLKTDLSIVKEYSSSNIHFSVSANGLAYLPTEKVIEKEIGISAKYLQLKYSENGLDNNMNLFNQAFKLQAQDTR